MIWYGMVWYDMIWYDIYIYMIYICVSSHEMLSKTLRLNWLEYYALYLKLTSNWHAYKMIHIHIYILYIYTYFFIENIFCITLYVQHIWNISTSPYRYQMNISQQCESTTWRNDEHKPWQGSKALSKTALGNKYIRHSVIHVSLSDAFTFFFKKLRCTQMFYNVLIQHIQHLLSLSSRLLIAKTGYFLGCQLTICAFGFGSSRFHTCPYLHALPTS